MGSNPTLSARFLINNFSHRHCEQSEAIQKPRYLRAFQHFVWNRTRTLLSPIVAFYPQNLCFLPIYLRLHRTNLRQGFGLAGTLDEGTHVRGPSIYVGFRGLRFFETAQLSDAGVFTNCTQSLPNIFGLKIRDTNYACKSIPFLSCSQNLMDNL